MKDIFDSKRFGRYFAYELNTARQNCALTLLVTCAMPIIYLLLELLFKADVDINESTVSFRWFLAIVAMTITIISFPVKLYGNITERRAGSWWALIPVSRFEKFLSIILMTCVVLPVCFFVLYAAVDALVCLIPEYGKPLIASFSGLKSAGLGFYADYSDFGLYLELWLSWCANILIFTLGAIFFRKGKASKTILTIIVLGILVSSVLVSILSGMNFEHWEGISDEDIFVKLHTLQYVVYLIADAILLACIFFRIKTIKY